MILKNAVFWDVAPCRSYVNRRFGGKYCKSSTAGCFLLVTQSAATCSRWFLACGFFYPKDVDDTFLRNVGSHKIYRARHHKTVFLYSHRRETLNFNDFLAHCVDSDRSKVTEREPKLVFRRPFALLVAHLPGAASWL
jgi:hypothetical protein